MAFAIAGGGMLTSCNDFLDTKPMNEVVLEDFWTKKEDAIGVLNACYSSFASIENVTRMAAWGEARSENINSVGAADTDDKRAIADLLREGTKTTNRMANWSWVYTTINNCNTFIHYAPGVAKIDPNYQEDEMKENVAEATFIRDLCYFYLLRAFKAVPMSFEASIDDTKEYNIPATPLKEGIEMLIADLQKIEGQAKRRYYDETKYTNDELKSQSEAKKNTSRVTKWAVYALLAELNLWNGHYAEAIDYCDKVIEYKKQNFKERVAYSGSVGFKDMELYNEIPLIKERSPQGRDGVAYNEIFVDGNSFESIFEIGYKVGGTNSFVNAFYTGSNSYYGVPDVLYLGLNTGENPYFTVDDCRAYEFIRLENAGGRIGKYTNGAISFDVTQFTKGGATSRPKPEAQANSNWIVYRLTDIILMKAEALLMQGKYDEGANLIGIVYTRAHSAATSTEAKFNLAKNATSISLVKNHVYVIGEKDENDNYEWTMALDATANVPYTVKDKENDIIIDVTVTGGYNDPYDPQFNIKRMNNGYKTALMDILFAERHRELLFEGKRWFDLVRRTLRENDWSFISSNACLKQRSNQKAVEAKLLQDDYIFMPYLKDELKVNKFLEQNKRYGNTEDFVQ